MRSVVSGRLGVALTGALIVIAAVVAAVVVFASGEAGEVDLTSAEFVPADAGLYVAFNTDLASPQWVNAFTLAERLGEDSPEQSLRDSVAGADLDWEADIAPFLGGNAAFFLRGADLDTFSFDGGVVVRCSRCADAVRVLRRLSGLDFESRSYQGFDYLADTGETLFISGAKGHLLVAMQESTLKEMLDLARGEGRSISSSAEFKQLRDDLTGHFLVFAFVTMERLALGTLFDDEVVRTAFAEAGVGDFAFKPVALVISAKDGGFEVQQAIVGAPGSASSLISAKASRFAAMVPADTAIFASTHGIAAAWEAALRDAGDEIDQAVRDSTPYRDLDEALAKLGRLAGLDSVADIIEILAGETAFALWFPGGDVDRPDGVMLAEVDDPARARDILERLVANLPGKRRTAEAGGVTYTIFEADEGGDGAYAIGADFIAIGSAEGVRRVLSGGDPLTASSRYRDALEQLDLPTGTYAFFDLAQLLRLGSGLAPVDLDRFERALGGALINIVSDRDIVRVVAFVGVEE